ncbi:MAG: hypothetical protein GY913_20045 [Proteobacteria bacterium]|nr:hypothetical protein [Pseudomonadota bacterium]MCP4919198.1 hypothetical protein [Pseudomonadota bacterium]
MTASILLALTACGDKDNTGDSGPAETDVFGEFIYVTTTPTAESGEDLSSCYTPGDDWLAQTPDASCATEHPFKGTIEDFQEGTGVADADLELFFGDRYEEGAADFSTTSDASGDVSGTLMACTPTTYRVYTDPALDETKITIQSHEVFANTAGAELGVDFNSVSSTTYNIIPGLLGITVQPGQGIVAGTAFGCGGDGDPVQFAQIIVRDEEGNYLEDYSMKYFVEEFPSRDQEWTSEDGLWVAVNIPPGRVTIEMWTYDGTDHVLQGETSMDIVPDSINIANIFTGSGGENGGVIYPESCLSACEG